LTAIELTFLGRFAGVRAGFFVLAAGLADSGDEILTAKKIRPSLRRPAQA